MRNKRLFTQVVLVLVILACYRAETVIAVTISKDPTCAVLPFVSKTSSSDSLAKRMRFAVAKKISRDGHVKRISDHDVNMMISALQLSWMEPFDQTQVPQVIKALGVQEAIMGYLNGHRLTLELYQGTKLVRSCGALIPSDKISPRLTVEKLLTQLAHVEFHHVSSQQADLSNPVIAARFKRRSNLVKDGDFKDGPRSGSGHARFWQVFLEKQKYNPRVIGASGATGLLVDTAAVVPTSAAVSNGPKGYCLMARIETNVAQNNGLAIESDWVPVQDGDRYRFSCWYHSGAPRVRIFLKGFAYQPDRFSNAKSVASQRFERYRMQVLPLTANKGWTKTVADFTPSTGGKKHKIKWIRIDFFVYLNPGDAFFRDVKIKDIGPAK